MIPAKRDVTRSSSERHYGEEDVTVITQDAVLATFDGIFDTLTQALAGDRVDQPDRGRAC